MKVCIDCTPLLVRSAGVKTYLYHLVEHLLTTGADHQVVQYPFPSLPSELRHSVSAWKRIPNAALALLATRLCRLYYPFVGGGDRRAALFHASNLIRDVPQRIVLTTTVHDLTVLRYPELHTRETVEADKRFFSGTVRRARRIIAVSNSTKHDLITQLQLAERDITVIYPGVGERYFQRDPARVIIAKAKYGIAQSYVLFVGTLEPRKNLERLLDSYSMMKESIRDEFMLVVVGMPGWLDFQLIARLREGKPRVLWLSYVPEEDMPFIVGGATLSVYPSLYEGFGFPVVEAMAAGVPVLTSNRGSLPEVASDAACLVDPLSVTEIRMCMERLLTSPSERVAMTKRGLEQARLYSWAETARQTWRFFEQAISG